MTQKKFMDWFKFFIGLCLIVLTAKELLPMLEKFPGYSQIIASNRSLDIDAGSLFYTETEEYAGVGNYLRNLRRSKQGSEE